MSVRRSLQLMAAARRRRHREQQAARSIRWFCFRFNLERCRRRLGMPPLMPPVPAPVVRADDPVVYTSASLDVQPPVIYSPKLPPVPAGRSELAGDEHDGTADR